MLRLLCPECLCWREPNDGHCVICGGMLDLSLPDPSLADVADALGDCSECFGEATVLDSGITTRGRLHATVNGLLFVPCFSAVLSLTAANPRPRSVWQRVAARCGFWLSRLTEGRGFSQQNGLVLPLLLTNGSARGVAELLLSDPGVRFFSRAALVNWRRLRGRWEFLNTHARWLPERFRLHDRDGAKKLALWWETTACPLQPTVR